MRLKENTMHLPDWLQSSSMSSREIADVVKSRHDKVRQSIKRLAERGTIDVPPLGKDQIEASHGRKHTIQVYHVNKRDRYVVVAQLCPEFIARLVDRWQELEARQGNLSNFSDPIAAAEAWIVAQKGAQIAQREAPALERARVQAVDQRDHAQDVTGSCIYKRDGNRAK